MEGGHLGIHSRNLGFEVLDIPVIFIFAGGVKTDGEGLEVYRQQKRAIAGAAVGVELLLEEGKFLCVRVVAPGVCSTDIATYTGNGEGKGLV